MKLIHGGDVAGYEAEYGAKPLDFSANINPLGLPQGVRQAVVGALETADAYPDPLCRKLRQAIAQQEGLPMEQVLCGPSPNRRGCPWSRCCAAMGRPI